MITSDPRYQMPDPPAKKHPELNRLMMEVISGMPTGVYVHLGDDHLTVSRGEIFLEVSFLDTQGSFALCVCHDDFSGVIWETKFEDLDEVADAILKSNICN